MHSASRMQPEWTIGRPLVKTICDNNPNPVNVAVIDAASADCGPVSAARPGRRAGTLQLTPPIVPFSRDTLHYPGAAVACELRLQHHDSFLYSSLIILPYKTAHTHKVNTYEDSALDWPLSTIWSVRIECESDSASSIFTPKPPPYHFAIYTSSTAQHDRI